MKSFRRLLELPKKHSFFLFGARGTGKSTLLKASPQFNGALWLNFLDPDTEEEYALNPDLLRQQVLTAKHRWVVLDEIQKVPKLLDVVHSLIEETNVLFALTGSSSRKLKAGGGNLLGGRAFVFSLFPFSCLELETHFEVDSALRWGTLPSLVHLKTDTDRKRYLRSYLQTYLKEEILQEQLIKNLDPFRLFLPIAAQMNSQIINYSNIARDTGVDYKTIQNYYQILVDTYLGHFLEPYSKSLRKVQIQAPKFYFFDTGVKRALQNLLRIPVMPSNSEYGDLFETWFVNECIRLNHYGELDYTFSYLRTKDDLEIDLIVERPGEKTAFVEVKSSTKIDERHIKGLLTLKKENLGAEFICACQIKHSQNIDGVWLLPWKEALKELGLKGSRTN